MKKNYRVGYAGTELLHQMPPAPRAYSDCGRQLKMIHPRELSDLSLAEQLCRICFDDETLSGAAEAWRKLAAEQRANPNRSPAWTALLERRGEL